MLGPGLGLKGLEPTLQQDLNGDGTIGSAAVIAGVTIEAFGSTAAVFVWRLLLPDRHLELAVDRR